MNTPSLGQRLIRKAVDRLGVDAVAMSLQLQRGIIFGFLDGRHAVPDKVLMSALDLIVDEIFAGQAANAPADERPPRRAISIR